MSREHQIGSVVIGLMLIVGVSQVQGSIVPLNLNDIPVSLIRTPGTLIVDHARVPLAVPSFACATTTEELIADLLPPSEQMYQDRHWGYWLGFSSWNGYSFLLTGQSPFWGRNWETTGSSNISASTTQVPEPHAMLLLGLGGAWLAARPGRCKKSV